MSFIFKLEGKLEKKYLVKKILFATAYLDNQEEIA